MQVVIRTYTGTGAKTLFDRLEQHKVDVEKVLRTVKGFVSYTLVRSAEGGFAVTVCKDKAGIDESIEKAKDWIAKNAGDIGAGAPQVSEGDVILHLQ